MANLENTTHGKIRDHALSDWLSSKDGGPRELIVEAALPNRSVRMRRGQRGRLLAHEVVSSPTRKNLLKTLWEDLSSLLETPPTLLQSAGSLAVRVNHREAQELLEHPLVKAVRLNRRLRVTPE